MNSSSDHDTESSGMRNIPSIYHEDVISSLFIGTVPFECSNSKFGHQQIGQANYYFWAENEAKGLELVFWHYNNGPNQSL